MSFLKDFKDFAMRGNVLDLAVGVIIGGAFGKVVSSLVSDILMPPLGMLLGGVDFSNKFINLTGTPAGTLAEAKAAGVPVISYGAFINTLIYFIIQAFAIYLIIHCANKFKKPEPTPAPKRKCPYCMSEIDEGATRCPYCTSELK